MKTAIVAAFFASLAIAGAEDPKKDPFEDGMREAFADYKKGDEQAAAAKLKDLIKLIEDRSGDRAGMMLPDAVGDWKGETLKKEDGGVIGGSVISRVYVKGENRITVKIIKDSPVVQQLLPMLANEDLIQASGRKIHKVSGESAVMDGEHKLQLVVDKRIYVEFEGSDSVGENDLVPFAQKVNLSGLAKVK